MPIILRPLKQLESGDSTPIDESLAEIALTQLGWAQSQAGEAMKLLQTLRWGSLRLSCAHTNSIGEALLLAKSVNWWWAGLPCEEDEMIACRRCRPLSPPIAKFWTSSHSYAFHKDPECRSFQSAIDPRHVYWEEIVGLKHCELCVDPQWTFGEPTDWEITFEEWDFPSPEMRIQELNRLAIQYGFKGWGDYVTSDKR